jgi:hypothetical protein
MGAKLWIVISHIILPLLSHTILPLLSRMISSDLDHGLAGQRHAAPSLL